MEVEMDKEECAATEREGDGTITIEAEIRWSKEDAAAAERWIQREKVPGNPVPKVFAIPRPPRARGSNTQRWLLVAFMASSEFRMNS